MKENMSVHSNKEIKLQKTLICNLNYVTFNNSSQINVFTRSYAVKLKFFSVPCLFLLNFLKSVYN